MRIKPYLQLVRLPNLFTAGTQSLAGWLLAGGTLHEWRSWLALVLASMLLYAAGIALNDVFDLELDRRERPSRPLPSGDVPVGFAWIVGIVGLVAGPALAFASGSISSGLVALALAFAILGYNLGLRRTVLGPEVMGICRGLNLLMGLAHAPTLGGPAGWLAAGSLTVFVCGITWISRWETETGRLEGLTAGLILENLGLAGLIASALSLWPFPGTVSTARSLPLEGLLVLVLVGLFVNRANSLAVREPVPSRVQAAVKAGVLSISWLDVGLVASVIGVAPALAIVALWAPAPILARWLYST